MSAIVVNTLTGAVSEYTSFDFHAITSTHAGTATGLYALGGDLDIAAPIVASAVTGKTLMGGSLKKLLDTIFFSIKGSGASTATVYGEANSYSYEFNVLTAGQSKAKPGRGIRENYLAFGYSNTDGAAFQLDRIEALVAQSSTRRV
jgi:hypothetical protein